MGSNSFRLVVFQYEPDSWWTLADEIREPTRVSAGMGDEGVLKSKPMDRAVHTAAVFSSFLEASGVERVDAVATSAIRDAANRDEWALEHQRMHLATARGVGGLPRRRHRLERHLAELPASASPRTQTSRPSQHLRFGPEPPHQLDDRVGAPPTNRGPERSGGGAIASTVTRASSSLAGSVSSGFFLAAMIPLSVARRGRYGSVDRQHRRERHALLSLLPHRDAQSRGRPRCRAARSP